MSKVFQVIYNELRTSCLYLLGMANCKKLIVTLILILMMAERALAEASLRVGTLLFNPPFVVAGANGKVHGFDIDLMRRMCGLIKRKCRYFPMSPDELYEALLSNEVDIALGGITITLEREEKANFTLPYMLSTARFVIRSDSGITEASPEQLAGKTMGTVPRIVFDDYVKLNFTNINFNYYDRAVELVSALAEGDVDFIILNAPTAVFWVYHSSAKLALLGPPFEVGDGLGFAVRKGLPKVLKELNQALLTLQNNGTYLKIYNKYF